MPLDGLQNKYLTIWDGHTEEDGKLKLVRISSIRSNHGSISSVYPHMVDIKIFSIWILRRKFHICILPTSPPPQSMEHVIQLHCLQACFCFSVMVSTRSSFRYIIYGNLDWHTKLQGSGHSIDSLGLLSVIVAREQATAFQNTTEAGFSCIRVAVDIVLV